MNHPFRFAFGVLFVLVIFSVIFYFIGVPMIENPEIHCPQASIGTRGGGCSTNFGIFSTIFIAFFGISIAALWNKNS